MIFVSKMKKGFALITLLLVLILSLLTIEALARHSLSSQASINQNDSSELENQLGLVNLWLNERQSQFIHLFDNNNFQNKFLLTPDLLGKNDSELNLKFNLPTQVKIKSASFCQRLKADISSCNSAIISNNKVLGATNFPIDESSANIQEGNLAEEFIKRFPNSNNSGFDIRITLISVISVTNKYSPILRIDIFNNSSSEHSKHVYAYVYGEYKSRPSPNDQEPLPEELSFIVKKSIEL